MMILKKTVSAIAASALVLGIACPIISGADTADIAYAVTSSELKAQQSQLKDELADAQNALDAASDQYDSVLAEQQAAEQKAAEALEQIKEQQEKSAEVQQKLASRVTDMYKNDQPLIFLNMVLGAETLSDMITGWNMMSAINNSDANMISQSKDLRSEIAMKQLEAEEAEMLAHTKAEEAAIIKENAQAKTDELQKKIEDLDSDIRAKVLEEAAVAAGRNAVPDKAARAGAAAGIPTNGDVVDYAMSRLGCPYVWAASGPNSFDCSGLVMWCYGKTGKSLPHNSGAQKSAAKAVIPVSEAQPGDVLYRSGHVGICIEAGGGKYIHAPSTGDVVKVASGGRWTCALRF